MADEILIQGKHVFYFRTEDIRKLLNENPEYIVVTSKLIANDLNNEAKMEILANAIRQGIDVAAVPGCPKPCGPDPIPK